MTTLGCSTQAPPPSTPEARTPTPGTVTRNNPAGDADSPVDAALERLVSEPISHKEDKFRTFRPMFADAGNWKRVRFWGYPSRAGFRYGKDNYAVSILLFEKAENDDPNACLTAFAKKALNTARLFDVKIGDVERLERIHPRGLEALDMGALMAEELRRYEARRARRDEGREQLIAMLERRKATQRSAARRRAAKSGAVTPEAVASESEGTASASSEGPTEAAEARAKKPKRRNNRFGLGWLRDRLRRHDARTDALEKRKKRKHPVDYPYTVKLIEEKGDATMPVLLTSGGFKTLTNDDQYLAAIVAHPSWPGSCLVQGIAVKVGTDPKLAEKALQRWLDEAAPDSKWRYDLREEPTFETR